MKKLIINKEHYIKDEKEYSCYAVHGNLRGRDVRVQLIPPDFTGYMVLDIVFGDADEAELVVVPFEMQDAQGKVIKGNTYMARTIDENGEVYECKVQPAKVSDKALLTMLLK